METDVYELFDRKVKRGAGDRFRYNFEFKHTTAMNVVHRHPVDVTGWEFKLFVHEKPVYKASQCIFSLPGQVANAMNGVIVFDIPRCLTDIDAGTYWYSIYFKKPTGHDGWMDGAKYIIADTLNPYFSIYPETIQGNNYKAPVKPVNFADYNDIIEGQEDI